MDDGIVHLISNSENRYSHHSHAFVYWHRDVSEANMRETGWSLSVAGVDA